MQTLNADERAIWEVLARHVGPNHPITANDIAGITGIRPRAVREIIRDMTIGGVCPLPVIGAGNGFYVSEDPALVREYADNLYHLSIEIFNRRKGVLETARRCGIPPEGQEIQLEMVL